MSTAKFHFLLSELRWEGEALTLERLARVLGCKTHAHLCQVFNNVPGRGGQTRRKVIRWLLANFPNETPQILTELGWDAAGNVLSRLAPEGQCLCGKEARPGQRDCLDCHAVALRQWRSKWEQTPEQRLRSNARSYLHVYVKRGKVQKGPCCICGAPEVQAHHDDYSKPLEVKWYCRIHHRARHINDLAERLRDGRRSRYLHEQNVPSGTFQ